MMLLALVGPQTGRRASVIVSNDVFTAAVLLRHGKLATERNDKSKDQGGPGPIALPKTPL